MSIPLRALLFRRTSEPSAITVDFDGEIYLVRVRRHRQARRYTLRIHAASRDVMLTMPPRGSVRQAKEFARETRRLDRSAAQAAAGGRTLCARRFAAAARRRTPHRASARCARHGLDRGGARASSCSASPAKTPHCRVGCTTISSVRPSATWKPRAGTAAQALGVDDQARVGARPVEPLGFVLDDRRAVLFLAADPCAAVRARLSRRP